MRTAQRKAILDALNEGPVSTFLARDYLGIPHPAGRIKELRESGCQIRTFKTWELDANGIKHLVAKYALVGGEA